jgi:hypothetical protein
LKRLVTFGLLVLGLVAALAVLLDFFAKAYAEDQIGEAITHRSQNVGRATASIDSFPFTGKLLVQGRVEHLSIDLSQLRGIDAPIAEIAVKIDGLEMEKSTLVGRQHVEIKHVDQVAVSVLVSSVRLQELAGQLGVLLGFSDDKMTVAGAPVEVFPDGSMLVLRAGPLGTVRMPIPSGDVNLLPCAPSVRVTKDGVLLSCESQHLPKILVDAIGSLDLQRELAP